MNRKKEEIIPIFMISGIAISFLYLSLTRHLNFDESLLLRAAWLEVTQSSHDFPFKMPIITLLSPLTVLVPDPHVLLIILRLIISLSVMGAFVYIYRTLKISHTTGAIWVSLCALSSAFITHAFEFRYDAAILVAWMIAFGATYSKSTYKYIYIGLICGWLSTHHIKGLFYALFLYAITLITILKFTENTNKKDIITLTISTAMPPAAWIITTYITKSTKEIFEFYYLFFELSKAQENTGISITEIASAIKKDLPWLAICSITAFLLKNSKQSHSNSHLITTFACAPLLFIIIHPHPWAYMLAPAIPFISLLVALNISKKFENTRIIVLTTSSLAIFAIYFMHTQYEKHTSSYSLAQTADTMRTLMEYAHPDDRIVDPSGIIYFLKPEPQQWYTDTLFRHFAEKGQWQANADESIKKAEWALNTYRLTWIPTKDDQLFNNLFSAHCGPIRLRQEDIRAKLFGENCTLPQTSIPSAW